MSQSNSKQVGNVPLLDITRDNEPMLYEMIRAISEVVHSGGFVGGPHCQLLEQAVAELCQTRHAIGCASGSDALLLSLMAIDLQPGDEVIVPSFTFFASVSAVTRLGATPVFIDIEPDTFNLDPQRLEELITPRTKAVMPIHLFGQAANMTAIVGVAKCHGIHVIEDMAQAIGAKHGDQSVGSMGTTGCISFYPTKNLGGLGDGGMVVSNDDAIADRVRLLANHGMRPRYYHQAVGINSRLDAIQAAGLNVKIQHLAKWINQRRENARYYSQRFAELGLDSEIGIPGDDTCGLHVWNQFTIRLLNHDRDQVRADLTESGIGSDIYYPIPVHRQECYRYLNACDESLPETNRASSQVLSLPIFPSLTQAELDRVIECVAQAVHTGQQAAA